MTHEEIIAAYDALMERALLIMEGAPYWQYISDSENARLSIVDGEAELRWLETHSSYGDWETEVETARFPAALLSLSDEQFAEWKTEQRAEYDNAQQQKAEAETERRASLEYAAYLALKAKFGTA